jgi:archaellum component FlaC
MRKLLLIAGVLTIAAGTPVIAPAVAQVTTDFESRIDRLQNRIQTGVQSGRLTRNEAERLRGQLRELRQLYRQFARDGISRQEANELQRRIDRLQERIQNQRRDEQTRDRDRHDNRDCPPGLAKKDPRCIPPGQAKKRGN